MTETERRYREALEKYRAWKSKPLDPALLIGFGLSAELLKEIDEGDRLADETALWGRTLIAEKAEEAKDKK